jgi:hypothetical protein
MEELTYESKISMYCSIGYANASRSKTVAISEIFEEEEWDELSESDREETIEQYFQDWQSNFLDAGWDVVD